MLNHLLNFLLWKLRYSTYYRGFNQFIFIPDPDIVAVFNRNLN